MKNKIINNIRRFLLEYIIVTFGVLTAFSINKWDENRLLKEEEQVSYNSFKKDLNSELYILNFYKQPLAQAKEYLKPILEKNFENIESLMIHLNTTFDLQERNATYINLKYSGKLEILNNDEIKKRITLYYETYYQALENMASWNYDFRLQFLQPYFIEKLKYNANKEDLLNHLNSDQFLNLIKSQYQLIEYNLSSIEKSENLINKIIEEIDKELGIE